MGMPMTVAAVRSVVAIAAVLAFQTISSQAGVLGLACGLPGKDHEVCRDAAERWAAETGNVVLTYPIPEDMSERLELYSAVLSEDGPKFDVIEMDVTWAPALADELLALDDYLSDAAFGQAQLMLDQLVIGDELKGIPFHGQLAALYYRSDLIEKYGIPVPETWDELEAAARAIQEGERAEGNGEFWGYVFQGAPGESLTANATEWFVSHSGRPMVDEDGNVSLDEPDHVEALEAAADWIGTIAPPDVLTFDEEGARAMFQIGNAAFMRNLSYAYPLLNSPISRVSGKVGVAFMPSANGNPPAALLDGWALAVAKRSTDPESATSLVRHLTSVAAQRRRALEAGFPPAYILLYSDAEVRDQFPIAEDFEAIAGNIRMRPSTLIGKGYAEGSRALQLAVQAVLRGERDAATALRDVEAEISAILSRDHDR